MVGEEWQRNEKGFLSPQRLAFLSAAILGRTDSDYPLGRWDDDNCTRRRITIAIAEMTEIKPSGTGESPLANSDWIHVVDPETGMKGRRETNTMPQWAGSCWYFLRFIDPHNDEQIADPK